MLTGCSAHFILFFVTFLREFGIHAQNKNEEVKRRTVSEIRIQNLGGQRTTRMKCIVPFGGGGILLREERMDRTDNYDENARNDKTDCAA